jgi:hypothetical protein
MMSNTWSDADAEAEAVIPVLLELQFDRFLGNVREGAEDF